MSIKKINGYKIKMDALLGHGAYGSVIILLFRSIRDRKMIQISSVQLRSSING